MPASTKYWIAFGDIHDHTATLRRIPGLAEADGVIISGDLTVKGGVEEAGRVLSAISEINPCVLAQIGNMDLPPVQQWLDGRGVGIHAKAVEMAPGLGLMGVGWSNPTPFGTPSEASEEQLAQWLEQAHAMALGFKRLVLVSHTPPHDTKADVVGANIHVGSPAVRSFIEKVQPAVCITGHIHEARSVDRIGDTVILNPGDLASGGYARLEWDGREVRATLEMVSETA